ncbi:MAG: efflux RND transporter periplasmic adaptor subunit [candidate division Zixibacteria bacterium]|nr:efflux RND transporter periplasmic adaptor subunit [candidate division Zixibacteria bacterium]
MANGKKKKKVLIFGGIGLVVVILIVVNLLTSSEATTKVNTAKVEEGRLVSLVNATGKVQPKTEVKISANVSGEIVSLPVKEGQQVKRGDLLVQLDPNQYEAQVRQSEASYDAALATMRLEQASANEAKLVYERQKSLFEKDLTSQEAYDAARTRHLTAQASLEAAESRVAQAKAAVDQARESLGYTTIHAPMEGIITDLRAETGEVVMGSLNYQATVIMVLSDLSEIEVEVEVDETDIAHVALDQDVDIELDAMPDTVFTGRVTEIGNTAQVSGLGSQDQVTNFMVTILVTDSVPNIKPGMTATCDITTDMRESTLKIPIGAVVLRDEDILEKKGVGKDGDEKPIGVNEAVAANGDEESSNADTTEVDEDKDDWEKKPIEGVFVVRDGNAVFVPVTTGIADQQDIEITSGLEEGDEIVVGPFRTLRTLDHDDAVEAEPEKTIRDRG